MNSASIVAQQMLDSHQRKSGEGAAQQDYEVYEEDASTLKEEEIPSLDLVSYSEANSTRMRPLFPASNFNVPGEDGMRQVARLQAKLNQRLGPEYVSTRSGPAGGPKVFYLEGWKSIDLANEIFGFNGWSSTIVKVDVDFCDVTESGRYNIGVSAIVRVTLRDGTFHEDVGYGTMDNAAKRGQGTEKAKKEAITDALKRALRNFGRSLGNCLYDKKFCEQVSKMKAQPPKYDMNEMKRPHEPANRPFHHEGEANNFKFNPAPNDAKRTNDSPSEIVRMQSAEHNTSSSSSRTMIVEGATASRTGERPAPGRSNETHASKKPASPRRGTVKGSIDTHEPLPAIKRSPDGEADARLERLRQAAERKAALQRKCATVEDEFTCDMIDMSASQLNRMETHDNRLEQEQSAQKQHLMPTNANVDNISYQLQNHTYHDSRAKRTRY
jgi:DNA repair and recombination protein RAD52